MCSMNEGRAMSKGSARADRLRAGGQPGQHGAAGRIGQRLEQGVEARVLLHAGDEVSRGQVGSVCGRRIGSPSLIVR